MVVPAPAAGQGRRVVPRAADRRRSVRARRRRGVGRGGRRPARAVQAAHAVRPHARARRSPVLAVRGAHVDGGRRTGWPGLDGVRPVRRRACRPTAPRRSTRPGYEVLRIAHGVPAMGAELTEDTIPAEVGQWVIDASVSFTKGCFTGQELVARIDSRGGNVPRHLRDPRRRRRRAGAGHRASSSDGAVVGRVTSCGRVGRPGLREAVGRRRPPRSTVGRRRRREHHRAQPDTRRQPHRRGGCRRSAPRPATRPAPRRPSPPPARGRWRARARSPTPAGPAGAGRRRAARRRGAGPSAAMPAPSSSTATTIAPGVGRRRSPAPRRGRAGSAFSSRLATTWASRSGSTTADAPAGRRLDGRGRAPASAASAGSPRHGGGDDRADVGRPQARAGTGGRRAGPGRAGRATSRSSRCASRQDDRGRRPRLDAVPSPIASA